MYQFLKGPAINFCVEILMIIALWHLLSPQYILFSLIYISLAISKYSCMFKTFSFSPTFHHFVQPNRRLCVAGYSGHVILFKFKKQECLSDILVLEIPITYENTEEAESPECEFIPRSLPKQPDSTENEKKVRDCVLVVVNI
jgi:hypothetical protein